MPKFDPDLLERGRLYSRTELAPLWGYKSHEAISAGVFTPSGGKYILLFVTRNKQKSLTQYNDYISEDYLYWEGQKKHRTDERVAHAHERGEEIHLFYRDIHHTPFRYYGQVLLLRFIHRTTEPSRAVFRLVHDLGPRDDIETEAPTLATLPVTQREAVVRARVGQGVFRARVLRLWKACAVTGIARPDLLRASHIKPWRSSDNRERVSRFNGLLLLPQYDHLFDKGYVTFDDSGRIELSPAVAALPQHQLGIDASARLRQVRKEHLPFLEYHRDVVFQKRLEKD